MPRNYTHEEKPAAKDQSSDIDIVARTLFGEAEASNVLDAQAIACVIMNRVRYPNWPNNPSLVCLQPWQFSCWNPGDPNRQRILGAKGAWFEKCRLIAEQAVAGQLKDTTNGATHYYATYVAKPKWARGKKPVKEVAHKNGHSHLFFNDIDTPPPQSAREALEQRKPITKSRTVKAGTVAAGATTLTLAAETVNQLQPAFPLLQTLAQYAPLALSAIALAAIAYIIWRRIEDRRQGVR